VWAGAQLKQYILNKLRAISLPAEIHIQRDTENLLAIGDLGCGGSNRCANLDATTCYLGTDKAPDSGDLDERTGINTNDTMCGLGCRYSRDHPQHWFEYGVVTYGKRFLPYYDKQYFTHADGTTTYKQRRDAGGRLHDLRSNDPWLYPADAHWLRMPCFHNSEGTECPLCDGCGFDDPTWPLIFFVPGSGVNQCETGAGYRQPMVSYYADTFFFKGSHFFPENTELLNCRTSSQAREIIFVQNRREKLYQTVFLRSGGPASNVYPNAPALNDDNRDGSCHHMISNMLIPATERVVQQGNACESSYGWDPNRIEGDFQFYNNHLDIRNRFNFMAVSGVPSFIDDGSAMVKLKNAVLEHVATQELPDPFIPTGTMNLKQVDRGTVMEYLRDYNWQNRVPLASLPKVQNVDLRARLHFKRTPVAVDLVIKRAKLDVSIIAHWVKLTSPPTSTPENPTMYPHSRARYYVTLGIRANMQDVTMYQPWLPEGHPDEQVVLIMPQYDIYAQPLPRIIPEKDWLEYYIVDNEIEYPLMQVPTEVEWWGCLNSFSNPKVAAIQMTNRSPTDTQGGFRELADKFKDVFIPGWPTSVDSHEDPNTIYSGGITIGFQ
jgi:hypothetical protein